MFGIYIHFPWCSFRCPYCDFAVATDRVIPQERYAKAVLRELELRGGAFQGRELRSLYFGGGTPSLWEPRWIAELVGIARSRFGSSGATEVTLEVNPESCPPERFASYRDAGVNRFSIGVQSFDEGILAKLGRRHRPEAAERAVRAAASVVANVAVDLIYGARRSSVETARRDAERIGALPVTHVSAYALTVDRESLAEETPFARMARDGRLELPSDDEVLAQARTIAAVLRRAGLRRYEISNHARRGYESVHNRLYWSSVSYLGVGAGACGCFHGPASRQAVRWSNHRTPAVYLSSVEEGRLPTAEEDWLGQVQLREERMMLALRTREGLPLSEISEDRRDEVDRLVHARFGARLGDRLVLTRRGLEVQNAIVARLL